MSTDLFKRAYKFYEKGNLRKAEDCCRKAIANDGNDYEAYNLLGVMAIEAKKFGDAHAYLQKAVGINNNYAEGYNNLGVVCQNSASFEEAKFYFNKAVSIKPNYCEALYSVGMLYYKEKKYDVALNIYKKIIEFNPNYAAVYNEIGNLLSNMGYLDQSLEYYRKSYTIDHNMNEAKVNFSSIIVYTHGVYIWEEYLTKFIQSIKYTTSKEVGLLSSMSIIKWISNETSECENFLSEVNRFINNVNMPNYTSIFAYNVFLESLITWRKENTQQFLYDKECSGGVYFLGESHALTCVNQIINIKDNYYKCQVGFIQGCKVWHLVKDGTNKYKVAFVRELSLLSAGDLLVLTIGEIDCRVDMGIFNRYIVNRIDWKQQVDKLIEEYFRKIIKPIQLKKIEPLVWGIPAPSLSEVNKLEYGYKSEYLDFIKYYNHILKRYCVNFNVKFIDNYAATSEKGISVEGVKLDSFHLRPDIFLENIRILF